MSERALSERSGVRRVIPKEAPRNWVPWIVLPFIALLFFAFGRCSLGSSEHPHEHAGAGEADAQIWTCSMDPQIQQPEPGQCPICGMDLIPLGQADDAGAAVIALSERAAILAQLRTVEVARFAAPEVDMRLLGRVEVDESRVRDVSAWIAGRVDKLYVRETGTAVKRGQTIASLYSPEVYAAHQDLITAGKQVAKLADASELARSAAESAREAARERLALLGVPDAEIVRMEGETKPTRSIAIRTESAGTVMRRDVTQGQYVETGAVLLQVADLSSLWVQLDAYERDLATLLEGQSVEISVEALPGQVFTGTVAFIDPSVDPRRRVARVRVEVANPEGTLRPGMFVEAVVRGEYASAGPSEAGEPTPARQRPLVVPASAPLFTGRRSLVYVELPQPPGQPRQPHYEPRVVELGPRMGEYYPVVAGLSSGERVVEYGAFVLDADLQIRGGPSMMSLADARSVETDASDQPDRLGHRVEAPEPMRAQLALLLGAYLDMQERLAGDDWQGAAKAAGDLHEHAKGLEGKVGKLPVEVADAWAALAKPIERRADEAARSEAIEGARGAFLHLSMLVEQLVQVFGNPLDQPIRLAFCPMANADNGAVWIQRGEVLRNSYFGATMLGCGEIRVTIEPGRYLLTTEIGTVGPPSASEIVGPDSEGGPGH